MNNYGQNIRIERQKQGISQEWLAIQLDISQAAYSKMEAGKTKFKLDVVMKISEILQVPIDKLVKSKSSIPVNFTDLKVLALGLVFRIKQVYYRISR